MARIIGILTFALLVNTLLGGCAKAPTMTNTGFLSTYENLEPAGKDRMKYLTGDFVAKYHKVIINRVQVLVHSEKPIMTAEEREPGCVSPSPTSRSPRSGGTCTPAPS
ncbi:MAG: hypothetical protein ACYSUR_04510 [Planctomycetota bacterium]|jgi:hypothetical protein